jgi:hypothetical protein
MMLEPPKYGRLRMRMMAAAVVLCLALAAPRSVATHLAESCQFFLLRPAIHQRAESVELPNGSPTASTVVPPTEIEDHVHYVLADAILHTVARDQGVWVDTDTGMLPGSVDHLPGTSVGRKEIRASGARGSNRVFSSGAADGGPQAKNDVIATAVRRMVTDGRGVDEGGLDSPEHAVNGPASEAPLIPEEELPTQRVIDDVPILTPNINPFDPNDDVLPLIDRLVSGREGDATHPDLDPTEDGDSTQVDLVLDDSITEPVDDSDAGEDDGQTSDNVNVVLDSGRRDRPNLDYRHVQLPVDEDPINVDDVISLHDVVGDGPLGGAVVPEPRTILIWTLLVLSGVFAKWMRK